MVPGGMAAQDPRVQEWNGDGFCPWTIGRFTLSVVTTISILASCITSALGQPPMSGNPGSVRGLIGQAGETGSQPVEIRPPTRPPGERPSRDATVPRPGRTRLPLLPPTPPGLGTPPHPTAEKLQDVRQFVEKTIDPEFTLDLIVGRPRLMILKDTPKRVQIGDEEVATYELITDRELSVVGVDVGTTVLNLWFADPQDPRRDRIISYLVRVLPDPEAKSRLEAIYQALAEEINKAFPDSWVCLALVGDKLVVSGQAKDIAEAAQILRIVRANAPPEETAEIPVENVNVTVQATELDGLVPPTIRNFMLAGGPNVINLLRVPGEQQVNLRVTVAEVDRAAARSIGMNFSITNSNGVAVFAQNTGSLLGFGGLGFGGGGLGGLGGLGGAGLGGAGLGAGFQGGLGAVGFFGQGGLGAGNLGAGVIGGVPNILGNLDNGQVALAINALRSLSYARTLAEPNLVTMNGQPASFLAGGQFPVPIITGFTGAGLQGVSFVPFGVQLTFTPYITDHDRIRLVVNATVSTRDLSGGATIAGAAVPGLNTRTFTTTVELREGQTLAVAGLIQNNLGANADRVPLLGDLPFFGNLWKFDRLTAGEQELVILVTPELVHPMESKEVPPLPGSDLFEPGDLEFYFLGRLESRRPYDYRSPVMNDIHRMIRYRKCENLYIIGPHGLAEPPAKP